MFILKTDQKVYDKLPAKGEIPSLFKLPKIASDYVNLPLFKNWIVGFTMSEGSTQKKNRYYMLHYLTLLKRYLIQIVVKKKGLFFFGLYNQFSVSSKTDIQTVMNFFSFSGLHPLIGLKGIQYLKWLINLGNSSRYGNLKFPE